MKIRMTFEFDDLDRRAIAHHVGYTAPATRDSIEAKLEALVSAWIEDLRSDMENEMRANKENQ